MCTRRAQLKKFKTVQALTRGQKSSKHLARVCVLPGCARLYPVPWAATSQSQADKSLQLILRYSSAVCLVLKGEARSAYTQLQGFPNP